MSRIAQVANFVTPTSGGLRTSLRHLALGYAAAGHEVLQVVPGEHDEVERTEWCTVVRVAGTALPTTGYRVVPGTRRVQSVLDGWGPDRLEVHDRTTLRSLGHWARRTGVPSLVVSHERLDRVLRQWLPASLPLQSLADRNNAALASAFDHVVCTTAWAAQEFDRIGVRTDIVPLGVEHDGIHARLAGAPHDEIRLVMASRLSKEKRPELAVETTRELLRRGHCVRLVVCGDGPLRGRLQRQAAGLPVTWRGFVSDRDELTDTLAAADVALAPGPVETFGLAALEALACGTPVVANLHSALPDVIGPAGRVAPSSPWCFADAVLDLLAVDEVQRRSRARGRAELFSWSATVAGFLDVHALRTPALAA